MHGVCGIFGVLCVGIFASGEYGAGWNGTTKGAAATATGVTGHPVRRRASASRQLGAQAIGALVICTVIFGIACAFFKIQNAIMKGGIRPTAEVELEGMDIPEMGMLAYPEDAVVTDDGELEPVELHEGRHARQHLAHGAVRRPRAPGRRPLQSESRLTWGSHGCAVLNHSNIEHTAWGPGSSPVPTVVSLTAAEPFVQGVRTRWT